ncbi:MAG: hypothetical protein Q4G46_01790 [Propionibacteriaceae bacterium]|nr:hypothetical protein [Propionibacteriaceae bacterium]
MVCATASVGLALAFSVVPGSADAATNSGSDSRPIPTQVFREDSPFYQKLPDDTPKANNSDQLKAAFKRQAEQYYGSPGEPNIGVNYSEFAPALYISRNSDPVFDIKMWNCQEKTDPNWAAEVSEMLKGVHIPADMIPDQSSDGSVSIYNEDTGVVVDMWQTRKNPQGQWEACWGGKIDNAKESIGTFPDGYGASASGLSQLAYTIRHQEMVNGEINHIIAVGLPEITAWPAANWPANRTDGSYTGVAITMGQIMRLPADLDIDAMKLSPAARTIAKAAQDYGIMLTETSGSVSIGAENYISLQSNSYEEVFRGRWPNLEMAGDPARGEVPFPVDQLEFLPLGYRAPLNNTGPKGPPPTGNPNLPTPEATPTAEPADPTPTAEAPEEDGESSGVSWVLPVVGLAVLLAAGGAFALVKTRGRGA